MRLSAPKRVGLSAAPWVNYTQYLCRVPNQQDCFDAMQAHILKSALCGAFIWYKVLGH